MGYPEPSGKGSRIISPERQTIWGSLHLRKHWPWYDTSWQIVLSPFIRFNLFVHATNHRYNAYIRSICNILPPISRWLFCLWYHYIFCHPFYTMKSRLSSHRGLPQAVLQDLQNRIYFRQYGSVSGYPSGFIGWWWIFLLGLSLVECHWRDGLVQFEMLFLHAIMWYNLVLAWCLVLIFIVRFHLDWFSLDCFG